MDKKILKLIKMVLMIIYIVYVEKKVGEVNY